VIAAQPLNDRSLLRHARHVSIPTYDRSTLTPGVVHISVGAFHRSHQAVYFDDLARRGLGDGWAITGVALHRRDLKAALDSQDGLYTVVSRGPAGDSARVVGVLTRYLYAPQQRSAVLAALSDRRTRLVTLTITTDGYDVDLQTGAFAGDHPAIRGDLSHPASPCSALGYLVEALDRRRRAGLPPFTVLSCDNLVNNGAIARAAVIGMAGRRDRRLAAWIDERGAFPGSLVDRITPGTTDADRAMVERAFGVRDRCPVMTEPFSQWVIEDAFCDGRPPLDKVGAQFVDDVSPHALAKTRLLNASHVALGHLGALAGYTRLDETMSDPILAGFVRSMMNDEIAPLLPPIGIDLHQYTACLGNRFANPKLADPLARLCRNGSAKVTTHLVPSVRDARALGRPSRLLTLAVAGWIRYLRSGDRGLRHLLADESVFGPLARCAEFAADVSRDLAELEADGVHTALRRRGACDSVAAVG
jgi:mannitol 2-dehydrogenase